MVNLKLDETLLRVNQMIPEMIKINGSLSGLNLVNKFREGEVSSNLRDTSLLLPRVILNFSVENAKRMQCLTCCLSNDVAVNTVP